MVPVQYRDQDFYPRSPCGERLIFAARHPAVGVFLSTLSLRRATPYLTGAFYEIVISIHALLAESDIACIGGIVDNVGFLSTLSLRRATRCGHYCYRRSPYFYPRSPCGERLPKSPSVGGNCNFYPRSPCGERLPTIASIFARLAFLSTLSLRRATRSIAVCVRRMSIFLSTLSLRRATKF